MKNKFTTLSQTHKVYMNDVVVRTRYVQEQQC